MSRAASRQRQLFRQAGISLLEVLAALVILSIGASVAFTWFGQSASAMGRLKEEESSLLARNEALEYLRAVNPVAQPTGEIDMPGYQLVWTSRPIREAVRTLTPLGTPSRYEVETGEAPWAQFQLQLAGYKQVASSSAGGMFGIPGAGAIP